MELSLREPTINDEEMVLAYLREFREYNSDINGVCGLEKYENNYQGWLTHLEERRVITPTEERVPSICYLLVDEQNRLYGISTIRLCLNEALRRFGGHIGYSIRPTERGNGYNNTQLYLLLERCLELGIEEALLDCTVTNLGSDGTIRNLSGELLYTDIDPYDNELTNVYRINVRDSLRDNIRYRRR